MILILIYLVTIVISFLLALQGLKKPYFVWEYIFALLVSWIPILNLLLGIMLAIDSRQQPEENSPYDYYEGIHEEETIDDEY